ncbi:hypothetical protein [Bradyrhizobium oligotrophicum]|uniref:hypothetical protein n=1 Tax=Bradyrhizobium oligotrophicum TaxID=44255 RepID=UPI003EC07D31
MEDAARIHEVALLGAAVPHHFERVDAVDLGLALRIVLVVEAGFGPAHPADDGIPESVALLVFSVALLPEPLRRRGQQLVDLHGALLARQKLHLLPVCDLLPGDAVDRDADPVEYHDRPVHLLEDVLVILRQLLAGLEGEILPRLFPPMSLTVAIMVALEPALQHSKQRVSIDRHVGSRALTPAAAGVVLQFVDHGILSGSANTLRSARISKNSQPRLDFDQRTHRRLRATSEKSSLIRVRSHGLL